MPNAEEAKRGYRAAWNNWCLTTNSTEKRQFEKIMDQLQPSIANGPNDPPGIWSAFIDTLPGYRDVWDRMRSEAKNKIEILKQRYKK